MNNEICQVAGCGEPAERSCENCDGDFCSDHCSRGGDRDGVAVPAICDVCAKGNY